MLIQSPGEITTGSSYSLSEFMERTGLKRDAMRQARRNGLQVVRRHGRVFILGSEWLRYLADSLVQQQDVEKAC